MAPQSSLASLPSRIASLVHRHFDGLPNRSKPNVFPDGSREWIPMTGIVIVKGENTPSETLTCVAVTTGAKCLSASHIRRCQGLVLHDCHAEILAIRAFNYWLLNECHSVLERSTRARARVSSTDGHDPGADSHTSQFVRLRTQRPNFRATGPNQVESSTSLWRSWPSFELQPDIKIYMYCTCAPCGDASMELCMAAQDDPTPWEVSPITERPEIMNDFPASDQPSTGLLDGRAHFSLLGVVRRKPARSDAEATRSKSCSDKLALRQVSSLLSFPTSLLVAPTRSAYLAGLVLPEAEISPVACKRSFSATGRMEALAGRSWRSPVAGIGEEYGFEFHPFEVLSVPSEEVDALWSFGKPKFTAPVAPGNELGGEEKAAAAATTVAAETDPGPSKKSKPGNISAIWVRDASTTFSSVSSSPSTLPLPLDNGSKSLPMLHGSKTGLYETIVNGVKQGNRASSPTARGASSLSRAKMWRLLREISETLGTRSLLPVMDGATAKRAHDGENWTPSMSGLRRDGLDGILVRICNAQTYEELKRGSAASAKYVSLREKAIQDAKNVLKGWLPNRGDENWGLDVLIDTKKKARRIQAG